MASSGISNLSNLLPSGTFLAFQTLTPIFASNGHCGPTERMLTVLLVGMFAFMCFGLSFTDSVTSQTGEVFYGIVTKKGLWNPQLKDSGLPKLKNGSLYADRTGRYIINIFDFINGVFNVVLFSTVALLTSPATPCIYPNISSTIVRCVPVLIGLVVTSYFSFAPKARQGVGFAVLNCQHGEGHEHDHHSGNPSEKNSTKARELERNDNEKTSKSGKQLKDFSVEEPAPEAKSSFQTSSTPEQLPTPSLPDATQLHSIVTHKPESDSGAPRST